MTTREFRRYTMKPERFDSFLEWYLAGVPALRARYGFTVEFCVIDREHLQFDWVGSYPGTEAEFAEAAETLKNAPEWREYYSQLEPSFDRIEKSFVEVVVP